jgi:hypothetical protein
VDGFVKKGKEKGEMKEPWDNNGKPVDNTKRELSQKLLYCSASVKNVL